VIPHAPGIPRPKVMPHTLLVKSVRRFRQHIDVGIPTFLLTFGAIFLGVVLATSLFRETYIGVDDANIAMVYARNLAAGRGFVYNVGGEHVEGFTSLLYVLITAGVFALSSTPELCMLAVCVLLVTASVFLPLTSVRVFTRNHTAEPVWLRPLQLAMVAWAVGSAAFIIWNTVSLMDTALWTFMWSCAVTVVLWEIGNPETSRLRVSLMSTLAFLFPLARPEGFAAGPACILMYAFGRRLHTRMWREVAPSLLLPGLTWLLATVSITAFRIAYFGFPLPNTYYAKVSPNALYSIATGTRYLVQFVAAQPLLMSIMLGASAAGFVLNARLAFRIVACGRAAAEPDMRQSALRAAHFTVGLLSLVGLLLPVYGGGDHFAGFRFYQPIWPTLILGMIFLGFDISLALGGMFHSTEHHRLAWTAAIASLPMVATLTATPWPAQPQPELLDQFQIAEDGRRLGAALNRLFPGAPPQVGVTAAGGVQYTYQGPVFDMLGLNDVRMGHSPGERRGYKDHAAFDETIFWSVAPPVVLPVLCPGPIDDELGAREFRKLSDGILGGLFRDPVFEDHYLLVAVHGSPSQRVFDKNPFFFMPSWFPHPSIPVDDYRNATLIAFLEPDIIDRLASQGWRLVMLSDQGHEAASSDASSANGPCTPPQTRLPGHSAAQLQRSF
jgi:arabinofuranosyltransferase